MNWDHKGNRGGDQKTDYGYYASNHLSSAGCAPGEIGGSICNDGISWFADNISIGDVELDGERPLNASGWCQLGSTEGNVALGWFNPDRYVAPATAPASFIGWHQRGDTISAACGGGAAVLTSGNAIAAASRQALKWSVTYDPAGGANGCGQVTLSVGDATSTLSLNQEQRKSLSVHKLNRFGIVGLNNSGQKATTLWLDNLVYTKVGNFPAIPAQALKHTRTDFFDVDPTGVTWFGDNNIMPHEPVTVTQDYKYQPSGGGTGYDGASGGGCIGGRFNNAIGTSYYAYKYDRPLHFTDKLRTEGYIQFPKAEGYVAQLGWTASKNGLSWREPNTFGFRFGIGKNGMLDINVDIAVKTYQGAGGNMATQALPTVAAGSQWHHYVLEFDPEGNGGGGTVTVGFDEKTTTFNMPPGKKAIGADLDLFGIWNQKVPAKSPALTAYIDDIKNTVNGKPDVSTYHDGSTWHGDFSKDPGAFGWVGVNNSFTAKDNITRPFLSGRRMAGLLYGIRPRRCGGQRADEGAVGGQRPVHV